MPAGHSGGGQWTRDGGGGAAGSDPDVLSDADPENTWEPGAQYAQNERRDIQPDDFLTHHIIDEHVDKTDAELVARIRSENYRGLFGSIVRDRAGTFDSAESARDFISRTLEQNSIIVDKVASGDINGEFVTTRFGYKTGREAVLDPKTGEIRVRATYEVGVAIVHDKSSPKRYRIVTADPRNYNERTGR